MPGPALEPLHRPGRDREEVQRVEGVQPAGQLQPPLPIQLAGKKILGAHPRAHDEVATDGVPDGHHDLVQEARPVLETAAVLIISLIHRRRKKFVWEHIPEKRQLHAVESALPRPYRRRRVRVHDLMNLGNGQRMRDFPGSLVRHVGGAHGGAPGHQRAHPAAAVHQLARHKRAEPVDLAGHAMKGGNDRVVEILDTPSAAWRTWMHAGRPKRLHKAGPASRFLDVVPDVAVRGISVRAKMRVVGRADDPILYFGGTDPERRK